MRKGLLVFVGFVALAFPASALAGPCGLPDTKPVWADFAALELERVWSRPGVVAAASSGTYPARLRAAGAKTVYWDMNLNDRTGTPTNPADPASMEERANRLFVFAASQTACATPWIALNELFGAGLETPWTPNNAQYRANVLALMRGLSARGARPFLLISEAPYTGSPEAANWWRSVAQVGDIVREVYPNSRLLYAHGPVVANRRLRISFRRGIATLTAIGIPIEKTGLVLGFQSRPGTGGREGLRPRQAWFRMIKWQALAARTVAAEMGFSTIWSWGWGTYSVEGRDPDKMDAACVYLWARNPNLCNGRAAAGKGFIASRTEGQLILPGWAMCRVGRATIGLSAIARLSRFVNDRDVAYSALFSRLAEAGSAQVSAAEIRAAEGAVISRFGSRGEYLAALAKAGASRAVARGVLADSLRRHEVGLRLRVSRPSGASIAAFYEAYPELRVRSVSAQGRAPWWLGARRAGLALATFVPERLFEAPTGSRASLQTLSGRYTVRVLDETRPLAAVPLAQARPAISAALTQFARRDAVTRWSTSRQEALLRKAVCRRDNLPEIATIDLTTYLPFLALAG